VIEELFMSTNSPNVSQPKSSQGIPGWLAGLIVAVVLAIGLGYLGMQFMKEVPKKPSVKGMVKPTGPGVPGGSGPGGPPSGMTPPDAGGTGGRPKSDAGTEAPEAKSTPEKEPEPGKESK